MYMFSAERVLLAFGVHLWWNGVLKIVGGRVVVFYKVASAALHLRERRVRCRVWLLQPACQLLRGIFAE